MGEYTNINNADATLLALWKYFHYRTLALNFLNKAADAYEEHIITPVCHASYVSLDMNSCKRVDFKVYLCMKNTSGKDNRRCLILIFN